MENNSRDFIDPPLFPTDDTVLEEEEATKYVLLTAIFLMLGLFAVLLSALSHNIVLYVLGQSRYKNFHISLFYVLAFIIISLRITVFCLVAKYLIDFNASSNTS